MNSATHSTNPYAAFAAEEMQNIFALSPNPFQAEVMGRLLEMGCGGNECNPLLLVQGTGGGKSAVYQVVGKVKGNVTLIIESTLSLSSDQLSKIEAIHPDLNVHCIQLDSLKSLSESTKIFNSLDLLLSNNE